MLVKFNSASKFILLQFEMQCWRFIKLYIILYCDWDFWRLQDDVICDDSEKDDEIGDDQ